MKDLKNLKGRKYGFLEVIENTEGDTWLCACRCGNLISVPYSVLNDGKVRSCGCLPAFHKEGRHWVAKLKRPGKLLFLGRYSNKSGFQTAWKYGQLFIHGWIYSKLESLRRQLHEITEEKNYDYQNEEVKRIDAELQRVIVAVQRIEKQKRLKYNKNMGLGE